MHAYTTYDVKQQCTFEIMMITHPGITKLNQQPLLSNPHIIHIIYTILFPKIWANLLYHFVLNVFIIYLFLFEQTTIEQI